MSKTYRLVWSKARNAMVVTSELARTNGKGSSNVPASGSPSGTAGGRCARDQGGVAPRLRRFPAPLALGIFGFFALNSSTWATCTPSNPSDGATVTCSGAANLLAPSYSSTANNLTVNVNPGAGAGVLLGELGNAMTLTGNNVTLNNGGTIDPSPLVASSFLSTGTVIGNASANTVTVNNSGTMKGTAGLLGVNVSNLNGVALAVQNGTGGVSNFSNTGTIGSRPLLGISVLASDALVMAAYGGGQVSFINNSSGTINGRVAFQASGTPGTGHSFVNAGAISGSVSMGASSTNTFTAVTGSTVSAGGSLGLNPVNVIGLNLGFAATGTIDGGAGGNNTLLLQNAATGSGAGTAGSGTITSGTYINFKHLGVNSGTWTLSGTQTFQDATLTGGLAIFENATSFGTGAITAKGGAIQASTGGLTVSNSIGLQAGGLMVQGANDLTLSGVISGTGGLTKNDAGVLTLTGANTYSGDTNLNGGKLILGNAGALGNSKVVYRGSGTLETSVGLTLANPIALDSGVNLTLGGSLNTTLGGAISGAGAVIKDGAATTTLTGANTYSGGTTINAGTLALGAGGSLAATGAVSIVGFGAGLDISAAGNQTIGFLSGMVGSKVTLGGNTLTFGSASNSLFFGSIVGTGGLVKQGSGTATLSGNNTFAGGLTINAGTLALGAFGILPATGAVNVAGATAVFDISAGGNQTIGSLAGVAGSRVALGANTLTLGDATSQTFAGAIGGSGSLVKNGAGTLTLSGASSYAGGTELHQGRLNVGDNQALGTGALAMDDDTTLGFSTGGLVIANTIKLTGNNDPIIDTGAFSGTLSGAISGAGFITKQGTGTLTLSGANTYTGATSVAQGTLKAGAVNTLSAVSAHSVAAGATLDLAGFNQTVASLANNGTVSLVGTTAGTTLTVNGPYVGNNGVLKLGTALNGSGPSDRLILNGPTAVASGKTMVQIANLGGLGALTSGNGIEVITAQGGATTTAQTTKDAFSLVGGHVDAGAYEYRLNAADANGAGENWYLRTTTDTGTPAVVTPGGSNSPGGPARPTVIAYRAEASLYAALPSQLRQGNLAMLGDVRKRVGDDDVKGSAATPTGSDRRAWARVLSTDIDIRQGGTVSPTSKGRLTGFQAGTDLLATSNWRAGIYVGQLDGDATVNGFASGVSNLRTGRNDLRSQYMGVYGTYTGDSGFYADAVVQSGRHRYTVQSNIGTSAEGKGNSLLGSIEVGQAFALGGSGWSIEPQLQLIHQHLDLNNSVIVGAVVQPHADSGWIARAGVRVKGLIDTGIGALQPYGRFNVYKTSSGTDVARFVNGATATDIAAPTGGTSTELAGGFTLALNQTTSLYGEVGKLWSSGGNAKVKSSINGSVGVRVKW